MPCNASNHSFGCDCGWGGKWHGNTAWGSTSNNRTYVASAPSKNEYVFSPEVSTSFMTPNANCPVCGVRVYFYSNSFGSRVFFDDIGPPWPKHRCTDRAKTTSTFYNQLRMDEFRTKYEAKTKPKLPDEKDGWKIFRILRTKSFRHEIEHLRTGRKFETSLIKDKLPLPGVLVWIKLTDSSAVKFSYFDMEKVASVTLSVPTFDARKFATITEWTPFKKWFDLL